MRLSSYENVVESDNWIDEGNLDGVYDREENDITHIKYHRMPVAEAFEDDRDRIGQCNVNIGHTLRIKDPAHIVCVNCDAEWKDEGF